MGKVNINLDSLKSGRDWVRHQVNSGQNIYRILPPFGSVSDHNNYPYKKWCIAWLFNPKTGKRMPFGTPATNNEECPIQEYNRKLNDTLEQARNSLKSKGLSAAEIKQELEGLSTAQWQLKLQVLYAYNACDKSGKVGLLELKTTAHKGMKKAMHEYIKDYGQDPTSLNSDHDDDSGVWFAITKEGEGKDTEYSVAINQIKEKVNGKIVKEDDRSPLPDGVVSGYDGLGYDLDSIYQLKSYDELYQLLLANLAILAEQYPEVVLDYPVNGTTKVTQASNTAVAKPAMAKKSVALQLDDEDDDEPVAQPKKPVMSMPVDDEDDVPAVKSNKKEKSLDELASDILGDL